MTSFFSLGGGNGGSGGAINQQRQGITNNNETNPESWFLYSRNNNHHPDQVDIQNKGFELWQAQDYGQVPAAHHHHQLKDLYPSAAAIGSGRGSGVNLVSDHSRSADFFMLRSDANSTSSGGGGSSISCQDCGNQAKKDCTHMRCRTCCKSRGFRCQTHVKSTWVPAAKRRERLQQLAALHRNRQQQDREQDENVLRYQTLQIHPKKLKDSHSTANPNAFSSGLELGNFPAEVTSPAVFRCVRVSSINGNPNNQYGYQTSVNIGGHFFKGILYDQGLESSHRYQGLTAGGGASSSVEIQRLNLITNTSTSAAAPSQGATFLDPSLYHSASLNSFMAGTQFFPPTT